MDWVPVVSTAIGAIVAIGGAVTADLVRSRHERGRDRHLDRRQSYLELMLALQDTHARLREIADQRPADLRAATREAFAASGIYETREKFLMTAAPSVATAGQLAFHRLIGLRDAVRAGAGLDEAGYHEPMHELAEATWLLRMAIRTDLGNASLTPGDVERESWAEREHCDLCAARAG